MASASEFGSGVVVPLVKFSEHIGDVSARRVEKAIRWVGTDPMDREKIMANPDPEWTLVLALDEQAASSEKMLDDLISLWAYAASDHLFELDRSKAPESLIELAALMMDLRFPSVDGSLRGEEEWLRMLALWSSAAMDLDEMLGVQRADWGEW